MKTVRDDDLRGPNTDDSNDGPTGNHAGQCRRATRARGCSANHQRDQIIGAGGDATPTPPGRGTDIGAGRRWHDIAYRLLEWTRKPPRHKVLSYPARQLICDWTNTLDFDREQVWSFEEHSLVVPADEHVAVPTLWAVELFPPIAAADLRLIAETYDPSAYLFDDRNSTTLVSQSRGWHGHSWFGLAEIKDSGSHRIVPRGRASSPYRITSRASD